MEKGVDFISNVIYNKCYGFSIILYERSVIPLNSTRQTPRNEGKKVRERSSTTFWIAVIVIIFITAFLNEISVEAAYLPETPQNEIKSIVEGLTPELDISSTSGISKEDFIYALENCEEDENKVLAENAELIWNTCQRYKINEFALCGLISFESGWCDSRLSKNKKNIMSIRCSNGEYIFYDSYGECIHQCAKLLKCNYINEDGRYATGGELLDIAPVYLGSEEYAYDWAEGVSYRAKKCAEALILPNSEE